MVQKIKIALLIGINYIGTSSELSGCINDTDNLKVFLKDHHKVPDDFIKVMTDKQGLRMRPTKNNIIKQLRSLISFSNRHNSPNKQVLIFLSYSGHGYQIKNSSRDEDDYEVDGLDEVICPLDYSRRGFITDDYIKKNFIDKLHSRVKLVMIMDCCNSGSIADLEYEYALNRSRSIKRNRGTKNTRCTVSMIAGCRDGQTAADAWIQDYKTKRYESQGAMTASFIACYKDGISYEQLMLKMRTWLRIKGYTQIPQLSSSKRINTKSQFLLSFYD